MEARQGRDVHVRRTRPARAAGSENPTGQRKALCGGGTARARLPFVDQLPAMFMTRTRDVLLAARSQSCKIPARQESPGNEPHRHRIHRIHRICRSPLGRTYFRPRLSSRLAVHR